MQRDSPLRRVRLTATAVAVSLGVLLLVSAGALFAAGGRWYVVSTPSMGEAAPVGTLIVTVPQRMEALSTGDIVSFTPPGRPSTVFTHRLKEIHGSTGQTQGDVNGAEDPWPLTQPSLIGRAVLVLPAAGWAIRLFPPLLAGIIVTRTFARLVRSTTWRTSLTNLGISGTAAWVLAVMHPFAGAETVSTELTPQGLQTRVIATGLFRVRIGAGDSAVQLHAGQLGQLLIRPAGTPAHYSLGIQLDPTGPQWLLLACICLLPLTCGIINGLPAFAFARQGRS